MDYIVRIEDFIVWWDEEIYSKVYDKRRHELVFSGSQQHCEQYIKIQ